MQVARTKEGRLKVSSIPSYKNAARALKERLGEKKLRELTALQCQTAIDELKSRRGPRAGQPISWQQRQVHKMVLKNSISLAMRLGLVNTNVADAVRAESGSRKDPIVVSLDEVSKLVAYARTRHPLMEGVIIADVITGCRRGELLAIRWRDVNWKQQTIHIKQALTQVVPEYEEECAICARIHPQIIFGTPKTKPSLRTLPLVPELERVFEENRKRQLEDKDRLGSYYIDHDLIFAMPNGDPVIPSAISARVVRYMNAVGIRERGGRSPSMRTLRASSATALLDLGMPMDMVASVMGHTSQEITKRAYIDPAVLRATVAEAARGAVESIALAVADGRKSSDQGSDHNVGG